MGYLYCIVQQCSNISCMGSLNETMLNMQLYKKYFYFMMVTFFVCLVCSCITYISERAL